MANEGMAGIQVNPRLRTDIAPEKLIKDLIMSPLIYLRLAGILFSIIVFGCVSDEVSVTDRNGDVCYYNGSNACSFAVAVGVIAFLMCLVFLVKDFFMVIIDFTAAMKLKMLVIMIDIGVNAFWMFMWFVNFCYTADQRRKHGEITDAAIANCANAGIAFSFFSLFVWGGIIGVNLFFLFRIIKGQDRDSGAGGTTGGYASFPEGQEPPGGDETPAYTPPEY